MMIKYFIHRELNNLNVLKCSWCFHYQYLCILRPIHHILDRVDVTSLRHPH